MTEESSSLKDETKMVNKYNIDELERINRLGKGGFCNVYLVNTPDKRRLALKELHLEGIDTQHAFYEAAKDLIQEADILQAVNHQNIVGLGGISDADPNKFLSSLGNCGTYFILLDVMIESLELRLNRWYNDEKSWKRKSNSRLSFRKASMRHLPKEVDRHQMMQRIRNVVLKVANAMEYLHDNNIIFQDLKPENIGFEIQTDELKMFDFGMARRVHPTTGKIVGDEEEMICGTPRYFAPEIFDFSGGTKQTDVYAFGIMLHEICSMTVPFKDMEEFEEFQEHICAGGRPDVYDIPDEMTRHVITDCTMTDPALRPSFGELKMLRLPELLENEPTDIRHSFTPSADLMAALAPPVDLDENDSDDDISEYSLPQDFDIVPFGSPNFPINRSVVNTSMPHMHMSDDEDSVNSRGLCSSTHTTSSDFFATFVLPGNDDNVFRAPMTAEQELERSERLERKLKRNSKPKKRKEREERRKAKKKEQKVRRRRSSQTDGPHLEDSHRSSVNSKDGNAKSSIPRKLSYDDVASFADNASLDDPFIGSMRLNDMQSSDDNFSLDDFSLNDKQESSKNNNNAPKATTTTTTLPPPSSQKQTTTQDLDDCSRASTKKKKRKKKKDTGGDDDDDDIILEESEQGQPPPPPPPAELSISFDETSRTSKKNKQKKKKKETTSANDGDNDVLDESSEPPPPPPDELSLTAPSQGTRKKKKKKKTKSMDVRASSSAMNSDDKSFTSLGIIEDEDFELMSPRTKKKKKKMKEGKKKDASKDEDAISKDTSKEASTKSRNKDDVKPEDAVSSKENTKRTLKKPGARDEKPGTPSRAQSLPYLKPTKEAISKDTSKPSSKKSRSKDEDSVSKDTSKSASKKSRDKDEDSISKDTSKPSSKKSRSKDEDAIDKDTSKESSTRSRSKYEDSIDKDTSKSASKKSRDRDDDAIDKDTSKESSTKSRGKDDDATSKDNSKSASNKRTLKKPGGPSRTKSLPYLKATKEATSKDTSKESSTKGRSKDDDAAVSKDTSKPSSKKSRSKDEDSVSKDTSKEPSTKSSRSKDDVKPEDATSSNKDTSKSASNKRTLKKPGGPSRTKSLPYLKETKDAIDNKDTISKESSSTKSRSKDDNDISNKDTSKPSSKKSRSKDEDSVSKDTNSKSASKKNRDKDEDSISKDTSNKSSSKKSRSKDEDSVSSKDTSNKSASKKNRDKDEDSISKDTSKSSSKRSQDKLDVVPEDASSSKDTRKSQSSSSSKDYVKSPLRRSSSSTATTTSSSRAKSSGKSTKNKDRGKSPKKTRARTLKKVGAAPSRTKSLPFLEEEAKKEAILRRESERCGNSPSQQTLTKEMSWLAMGEKQVS